LPPWVSAPPPPFPSLHGLPCQPGGLARQTMKRGDYYYCSVTQGGASLALGYYLSPLRGLWFRLLSLHVAPNPAVRCRQREITG